MDKIVFRFEIIGIIVSIIIGSFFHFTYEWSSNNPFMAIISAVNESTWEHLKMGFWPLLIWAIFEYLNFGKSLKNFVFAKFITLLTFCLSVPILFYTYIAILKENYLPIDILIFVVSITLGQLIGYKIMKNKKDLGLNKISIILILLMVLIFSLFYFFTPNNFLFKDPITGNYGITK